MRVIIFFLLFSLLSFTYAHPSKSSLSSGGKEKNEFFEIEKSYRFGDYKKGLSLNKKLLDSYTGVDLVYKSRLLFLLAKGSELYGNFSDFRQYMGQAEALFKNFDNSQVNNLIISSKPGLEAYISYGDYAKAEELYKSLVSKIGKAQADQELIKDLEYKHVIILYKKGFSVKAQTKLFGLIKDKEEYLKQLQSTPLTKTNKKTLKESIINAKRDFAALINLQSRIYFENGNYEAADSLAAKNELWLKLNLGSKEYAMSEVLVIKANCSEIREDYNASRKYYEKAYKLLQSTKEGAYRRTSKEALDVYTALITNFRLSNQIKDYKRTKDALETRLKIYYGATNYYYTRIIQLDIEREKQQGDWDKVIKYSVEMFSKPARLPEDHPDRVDYYAQLSNAYMQVRDFKNAQVFLERSATVQKFVLTSEAPLYHLQLLSVANYYVAFGDKLQEAEKIYLYSLDSVVTPQISHRHVKYLPSVFAKSRLFEVSDRYSIASKILNDVKEDIVKHYGKESIYSAMLYERLGNLNIRTGNYNAALSNLTESFRLFDKYGKYKYEEEEGLAHATFASLKLVEGNYDKAEQELKKAIKLSKKNNTASDNYINQLSQLYINTGRFSKIEDILKDNLELNEHQFGASHSRLVSPLTHLANLYIITGDYSKAEKFLLRSEEICLSHFGEYSSMYAELLKVRADLNIAIGDYGKADNCISQTVNIYTKIYSTNHIQLGMAYNKLALIYYYNKSNFNTVDNVFKKSLSILEKNLGDQNPLNAEVHKNYSLFLLEFDKIDAAKQHLEAANKIWSQKYGTQTRYAGDYYYLNGMIAYKENKISDAKVSFQKSKSIYESVFSSQHPDYLKALSKSGQMSYILKDYSEAIKLYDQAINSYQLFIRDQFPSLSEREKSKTWRNISKDFEFYYSMAYDLHKTNPDLAGNMFNMVLKTKALLLNSTVKIKRNILSSGDSLLISNYQNWLDKKELLATTLSMSPEELKSEGIVVSDLNKEIEQLEKHLSESSEIFASSNDKKNQYDWKQLKSLIKPEEAVIEIVRFRHFNKTSTDSVIYAALIIDAEVKDNPKFIPLANGNEMESKCLRLCRNSLKFRTEDKKAYSNYWEGIDKAIAKNVSKVYFSPDGVYNQLNIEAFKEPQGKYLLEKYQVIQITSSRDLMKKNVNELAKQSKKGNVAVAPKTTSYTLFGNPNYYITTNETVQNNLKQLPGAEKEVKEIYNLLKENSKPVQIFVQDSASEYKVKHLKSPFVFHVATHGFFIPDIKTDNKVSSIDEQIIQNPLYRSGLVLANGGNVLDNENGNGVSTGDGILTSYEAMNLDFDNTELVILSACETGLGDVQMGEGVYGLQRAFIVAGSKAVIMSLFKVDDNITKELMENFYSAWLKTGNKRQAFTQAKFEVMKKHSDPIDWSSFVMVGLE